MLLLTLAITLSLQAASSALPVADPAVFANRLDFYIRDGGEWRSANDAFKPGSDQPREYAYRWEWSLPRRFARLRIEGVFDNHKRVTYWENMVAWHPIEERALMRQVGAGGAFAEGTLHFVDDNTLEIRLTFSVPDGEVWAFKEIETRTGPDEFRAVSYRLRGGKWEQQQTATWSRVKKP